MHRNQYTPNLNPTFTQNYLTNDQLSMTQKSITRSQRINGVSANFGTSMKQLQEEEETPKYLSAFVFHPESVPRIAWDITSMLFIIYQAISVPYYICFNVPM